MQKIAVSAMQLGEIETGPVRPYGALDEFRLYLCKAGIVEFKRRGPVRITER